MRRGTANRSGRRRRADHRTAFRARSLSVLRDDTTQAFQQERRWKNNAAGAEIESVGRLAGGIAHDFNNLLTVINGYSELVLGQLHAGDPLRERVEEIRRAGEHASVLTQRLLAFSRKQTLLPQVLDLNRVVGETRPMLARLVGEDVELMVELHREAIAIYADPHQLEEVLMNLAVNSRDAMPRGGKLRIVTSVVEWAERDAVASRGARRLPWRAGSERQWRRHDRTNPPAYIRPFFTTKEVGKGTGLGLSMVHELGQSDGYIEVESEPGHGRLSGYICRRWSMFRPIPQRGSRY